MELKFTQKRRSHPMIYTAIFLFFLFACVMATLERLQYLPFALPAVAVLVPKKGKKYLLLALAAFLLIRFAAVWDGTKIVLNRIYSLSERTQSYEYTYFEVRGESAVEAVIFWLTAVALLVHPALLAAVWVAAMAYFGISPDGIWLILLLLAATLCVLPRDGRLFYGIIVGILLVGIGLGLSYLQPQPNATVSQWDEDLRDRLSFGQMYYEQEPIPSEVPEPEIVPPPQTQLQQPDHGIQKALLNVLFIVLATLTLLLLFVPAVIKDRAEKKARKNRAGFDDPDHAKAICTMFLYARRWQTFGTDTRKVPADVYDIWLEAAYSDHSMTERQRTCMHEYMVQTATAVWAEADRKKRLRIRYRACL